jgi:cytochrome P450
LLLLLLPQNIRKKFPLVLGRINQLCERLAAAGPGAAIDVDQAALRVTLDVIGLVRGSTALSHGSLGVHDLIHCDVKAGQMFFADFLAE